MRKIIGLFIILLISFFVFNEEVLANEIVCTYGNITIRVRSTNSLSVNYTGGSAGVFINNSNADQQSVASNIIANGCPNRIYYNYFTRRMQSGVDEYGEAIMREIRVLELDINTNRFSREGATYRTRNITSQSGTTLPDLTCQYGPITIIRENNGTNIRVDLISPFTRPRPTVGDDTRTLPSEDRELFRGENCPPRAFLTCEDRTRNCRVSLRSGERSYELGEPVPEQYRPRLICEYGPWTMTLWDPNFRTSWICFQKDGFGETCSNMIYEGTEELREATTCPPSMFFETDPNNPHFMVASTNPLPGQAAFCNRGMLTAFAIVGYLLLAARIIVPLILIIMGSIDLGKAVIANKDDEIKSSIQSLIRRTIIGIIIFFVPVIINLLLNAIDGFGTLDNPNDPGFRECARCLFNPDRSTCR